MRVHHISCARLNPPTMSGVVAHVFVVESSEGLVLVDTGFGLDDYADPARRLGPVRRLLRPEPDGELTAVRQLVGLGLDPADVHHVVLTHLDLDHAGGLSDFPEATVHTTADEHAAAVTDPDFLDRRRHGRPGPRRPDPRRDADGRSRVVPIDRTGVPARRARHHDTRPPRGAG